MDIPISINGLSKVYHEGSIEVAAVKNIDLDLHPGEVVGLFGPSGSGKTTLLSMLGCILRASAGELRVFGTNICALSEERLPDVRKKYISFIFQGFNLFPALTVLENVLLGLSVKGIKGGAAEERAEAMLNEVGLTERMHFLPRDLSGGQKQRAAVARALAANTPIILADEPTGNLDFANGRNVMEILRRLAVDQQRCVVVATHDNRIEDLFDRILYMEDGEISHERRSHQ